MFSQQISVDDSVDLQALIENNLVDGCVDITNITSLVNGNSFGLPSYAYFERGSSNFPFQNGIMLSTGGAASGGNAERTPTLSEGSTTWGTDPDLEAALGTTNAYVNATSIEFDFVSISNQFQFNYLLASEEYFGINPCQFSDGFVFLIKEAGSPAPFQNIALIPGSTIPVNTNTIHNEIFGVCPAQNEEYFEGYNLGDTNYNGRTTVLTASGSILPNVTYRIKLIIADQTDGTFDSAVFIEGDSFRILDLGPDVSTCASSVTLNADLQNPLASYAWYRNNTLIGGASNATFNAVQDGTYRVEVSVPVNGTSCVEEDEIVVVLNTEEPISPITNYELCDDSSADGIELFDLTTKDAELIINIENIPFTNYDYSYHLSETEARNNTNPITAPISNTTSPQSIFVRIIDLDGNCFAYTSFDLIVNAIPNIVAPTPLDICDGDDNPDGFAIIDLTQKNEEITSGNTNLFVSYHYNTLDVSTGNNPIPTPYINSTSTETVYARVLNTTTGCVNTTTLDVNVTISPIVNRDTQYIDACDTDLDGNANFDLTQVISAILNGLTNVSTTFHTTFNDAEMDVNAIADETNYEYTNAIIEPGSATIYLRVEDDNTGCASIVPFEIHTNLLLTATDTGSFAICDDDDDSTNEFGFNLVTVETFIENDLPNPITVTFYESEDDRDNGINALNKSQIYSSTSPQVLYISLDDGACTEDTEITLLVNPILVFPDVIVPYCDDDDDGITSIDLQSLDDIITNSNPNFTVSYFDNEPDAQGNINQLPQFYANTNPIETLYARIESDGSLGCSTVNPFQIEVLTAPTTTQPQNIIICDDNDDGQFIINLNDKISEIVPSTAGLAIDFYTSFDDADTNANAITDRSAYNTTTQTIYVRVEDTASGTGCYAIVSFEAIINTVPSIPTDIIFQICEDDGDSFADFLLVETDDDILNGQTDKEVFYFEDEIDATNGNLANAIDKNNIYRNTSGTQTIYIRVQNITDSDCFDTGEITLQVSPDPIYDPIIDFLVCDDASNDGFNEFNLDEKANEIQSTSPDVLNISFHLSPQEAEDNMSPLGATYTNITNPQSIYIRIESNASFCYVVEELGINIVAPPDVFFDQPSIANCDADYDGMTSFDLTAFNLDTANANFEVLDRVKSNLDIHYFENLSDINLSNGLDNTLAITNPTNLISNTKTVYIKVANTLTECFTIIPLELIVNLPPPIITIGTIPICDNDTDTYDLSLVNTMIVHTTTSANISYHNDANDAENNLAPLNTIYNYTASSHTIFARISDITTGCHIVSSFTLQINPNPIAVTPPDLISCDDDFDGIFEFTLSDNTNAILGSEDPTQFTITYYSDLTDAEANTNPLNNQHPAEDGDTVYARLENNNTRCYDTTQFNITVNPLPIININDIVPLCLDDLPLFVDADTGVLGETYSWSTLVNPRENNSTNSQIQINPTELGVYSVTVTSPEGCPITRTFEVRESEQAEITFTSTVNFADPNSITVDIDTSRIGNYVYILDNGEPQISNIFENVTFGMHTVTVQDLNGCMDETRDVFVFDIPKFVTPNDDSYFDTWHIIGADQLTGTIVYIYNRHGKLLKTLSHTSLGWDGTFNGQNMPSDDYWFLAKVIDLDGNAFDVKGHFALKR
ncbi:hypothetical protein GCM10023311_22360 [Flaviramulus aquimarinus]|uniref:Gliding motility-associated C-terminal domain-containing protein n=1 Tax=Flaviramulus aquimarinus TaxID=1170456 RepID=A0ABP9FBA7_9FLAO